MAAIITLHQLSKQYNSRGPFAIREVDLEIQEGEIFSLLGPNGAGKTTLLSVICGLFPPTSGEAILAGHNVVRDPLAVKQIIGVIPEDVALYPQLSGRRNLRYFGALYGLKGRELDRAVEEVLAVIGLAERAGDRVAQYSSGMKRRLNIGAGLLHKPRILLMDEPTVGLDPENRRKILDLVLQLKRERGTTVLYTTHYMEEAQSISDRVGILHQGQIIAQGTPNELIQTIHTEDLLRLDIGTATVPETTLEALKQVAGVRQLIFEGGTVILSIRSAAEKLPVILGLVEDSGVHVLSLTVEKPNLEVVFLHLTGQKLTAP
jgi:ABC-2 type transport system ATP-binding protein